MNTAAGSFTRKNLTPILVSTYPTGLDFTPTRTAFLSSLTPPSHTLAHTDTHKVGGRGKVMKRSGEKGGGRGSILVCGVAAAGG